jgi:hypothetical protein
MMQDCPVDEILSARKQVTGSVSGSELAAKLNNKQLPNKSEYRFLTLVMGRYLMDNCAK